MKNIFVGNLDFGATEDQVRSLFETYGTVDRVSIKTDRETGRSRGFAFVEMSNEPEAERAISALNGTNLGGRALNVNEARPKTEAVAEGPTPVVGVPAAVMAAETPEAVMGAAAVVAIAIAAATVAVAGNSVVSLDGKNFRRLMR